MLIMRSTAVLSEVGIKMCFPQFEVSLGVYVLRNGLDFRKSYIATRQQPREVSYTQILSCRVHVPHQSQAAGLFPC